MSDLLKQIERVIDEQLTAKAIAENSPSQLAWNLLSAIRPLLSPPVLDLTATHHLHIDPETGSQMLVRNEPPDRNE